MILIRRADEPWRQPAVGSLTNEAALQAMLADSPELLPGVDPGASVAREMSVPGAGYADLVMVDSDGSIVVVECKLRTNPEARRAVVGQILAYAAGLLGLSYHSFAQRFESRATAPLLSLVDDVDPRAIEDFQRSIEANLAAGRMRLIVAVDEVSDELKQTISYLNGMTRSEVEIFAIELGYVSDADIEILVPTTYGIESAREKARQSGRQWDETSLRAQVGKACSPAGLAAVDQLLAHGAEHGTKLYFGDGAMPSVTSWYQVGDANCAVWSVYTRDDWASIDFNFQWMRQREVDPARIDQLLSRLRGLDAFQNGLRGVEDANYMKRPGFSIDATIADRATLGSVINALDELIGRVPA